MKFVARDKLSENACASLIEWAHQDSNLEPRDSRDPGISARRGLSLRPQLLLVGRGTL